MVNACKVARQRPGPMPEQFHVRWTCAAGATFSPDLLLAKESSWVQCSKARTRFNGVQVSAQVWRRRRLSSSNSSDVSLGDLEASDPRSREFFRSLACRVFVSSRAWAAASNIPHEAHHLTAESMWLLDTLRVSFLRESIMTTFYVTLQLACSHHRVGIPGAVL